MEGSRDGNERCGRVRSRSASHTMDAVRGGRKGRYSREFRHTHRTPFLGDDVALFLLMLSALLSVCLSVPQDPVGYHRNLPGSQLPYRAWKKNSIKCSTMRIYTLSLLDNEKYPHAVLVSAEPDPATNSCGVQSLNPPGTCR